MRPRTIHHATIMKPGAELPLEITDVAYGGAGIARHEGRVVFIPFTIPGETVRARITKVHRSWMGADAVEITRPSPDRVQAPCPRFTKCGGCAYQHIAYPRQLEIKTRQVTEALRRIGKLTDPPVEPAKASPQDYGYRNRITVHVDPPAIGFRGTDPRRLVDIRQCLLAGEAVNEALVRLRSKKYLRPGPATLRTDPEHTGFRQVNDAAAEVLAAVVAEMAGRGGILVDAYCGAGFFARKLKASFDRVIGIDWDERSAGAARDQAEPSELYLTGDIAELLSGILAEHKPSTVLLDPPAQGVDQAVIAALLETPVERLVYVSCDPATLARDIAKLSARYTLKRAAPVDMFPQTASIETATLLEREHGRTGPHELLSPVS